jgi:hypothetical protein
MKKLFIIIFISSSYFVPAQTFSAGILTSFPTRSIHYGLGLNFNFSYPIYNDLSLAASAGGFYAEAKDGGIFPIVGIDYLVSWIAVGTEYHYPLEAVTPFGGLFIGYFSPSRNKQSEHPWRINNEDIHSEDINNKIGYLITGGMEFSWIRVELRYHVLSSKLIAKGHRYEEEFSYDYTDIHNVNLNQLTASVAILF